MISKDQTIFAKFDKKINMGLEEQKNMGKTISLEQFIQDKKHQFIRMREDFEVKYCEQAKYFAENMGPDLSYLAINSVKNIVYSIW